jgi:hypothetical protein
MISDTKKEIKFSKIGPSVKFIYHDQSVSFAGTFKFSLNVTIPAIRTVLIFAQQLTRMVGLIAFGRPDNSVIIQKVIKSMFKATYYTFCTLTTPATVTRSMGLPAYARAVKFFAATLFKSTLT